MRRFVPVLCLAALLSACSSVPVTPDPGPAHQAETGQPASRVVMRALPGWELRETFATLRGQEAMYVYPPSHGIIHAFVVPAADNTPDTAILRIEQALRRDGHAISAVERSGEGTIASLRWQGRIGDQRRRGIIAVREPRGHPGLLLVMQSSWEPPASPSANDREFAEQIDLMFLLATVE